MPFDSAQGLINGANLVGGMLDQGRKTQGYIDGLFDDHAKRKAGEAAARGDYSSAAGLLGSRGMLEDSAVMTRKGTATKALTAFNAGDYTGARDAAAQGGDADLLSGVMTDQQKEQKDRAAWIGNAADALLQIKDPAARKSSFEMHIVPTLKAMGLKDDAIAQIDGQSLTDEGLQALKTTLGGMDKMEIRQDPVSGDLLGVDPRTGETKVLHKGAGKKPEWKERKKADGSSEWFDINADPGAPTLDTPPTPEPKGAVYDTIATVAASAGAKPEEVSYLKRLGQVESSGNPKATNGKSTGVFQFHPDTFAGVGGTDINDVGDQTKAALALSRRDRAALQSNGIDPTDANVYIMHQQGAAGGRALLTAPPEVSAVQALQGAGISEKIARKSIVNNGGNADMTAGEFTDMWRKRWGGAGKAAAKSGTIQGDEANADVGDLSEAAVEQAAERYIVNGAIPPLGQGKAATKNRDAILNKAAEMEKLTGRTGAEAVSAWAGVKANAAALSKLSQSRAMVESFENTALKNADLMLTLAPKGGGTTNSPVFNRWIQAGRKHVAGDADVSNFDIALGTFADEYAKIVSGATGAQGSTDASRKEAYDRLSKYSTQEQLRGGIATMKQEMHNRITSMKDQEQATRDAISGKTAPPASAVAHTGRQEFKTMPPAMLAKSKTFAGSSEPIGSAGNPYTPVSETQYKNMPSGAHYVFTDGRVLVKK